MRPHLTEAEFRHTEDVARRFASGVGRDLHHKLLEKHKHARNWVSVRASVCCSESVEL